MHFVFVSEDIFLYLLIFVEDLSSGARRVLLDRGAVNPLVIKLDFLPCAFELHVLELTSCLKEIVNVFPQVR